MNKRLRNEPEELEKWVEASHEYSIAHLKEMIVGVEALDQDFDEVISRLNKMKECRPSSADDCESSFGFTGGVGSGLKRAQEKEDSEFVDIFQHLLDELWWTIDDPEDNID